MPHFDLGLYVVMAILAIGFIISLQGALYNPSEANIAFTAGTFIGTALLVGYAIRKGKK